MNVAHSADSSTRDGQGAAAAVMNDVQYSENPVQVKPQVCTDFCYVSKKQTSHRMWVSPSFLHPLTHATFLNMAQI
jgi:hypothetical protein